MVVYRKQDCTGIGPLTHQGTTITNLTGKANVFGRLLFICLYLGKCICAPNNIMKSDSLPSVSPIHIQTEKIVQLIQKHSSI